MGDRIWAPGEVWSWIIATLNLGFHDYMRSMIEPNSVW